MSTKLSIIFVWVTIILLLVMGLVMVTSTGVWTEKEGSAYVTLIRQCIFAGLGIAAALVLARIDYRLFRTYIWWMLLIVCFLLSLCYVPGIGLEINGERRWINLGFQFQPSECAKLVMVMALAHWFTVYREQAGSLINGYVKPWLIFGIPLMLIFFEKDMGTACALGIAGMCVMYVAGSNILFLAGTIVAGVAGLVTIVVTNANRMERILAWRDLYAYRLDAGMQQYRAQIAMERGGAFGTGIGESIEKHGTLPYAHTDFIYATLGEEFGLVGTLGVLLCLSLFAFFGVSIAMQTRDYYGRILAVGIVAIIFCPAMLNILVVTGIVPNSGLPLPFISTGGTNLVFSLATIGMLTSIQRHSSAPPPQYEFKRRNEETVEIRL